MEKTEYEILKSFAQAGCIYRKGDKVTLTLKQAAHIEAGGLIQKSKATRPRRSAD